MPANLQPIPRETPIVEPQSGAINLFFRQAWELLRALLVAVPTIGSGLTLTNQSAASSGNLLYTTTQAGLYRVTYYVRKTVADGVSSSVGFVWHWTETTVPLTLTDAVLATDTTGAVKSNMALLQCDINTQITGDFSYASNTPAKMRFLAAVRVELLN